MRRRVELRKIERMFLTNPVLDMNDYPPLDGIARAIQDMESLAFDYVQNDSLCYAYVREHNGKWFVDVCWLYANEKRQIVEERFVIAPGYQMSEMEERKFLSSMNCSGVLYNERVCGDFVKVMRSLAPQMNLQEYDNFATTLLHTYFASFQSGMRELLFKAGGLQNIAANLHYIDEWDLLAKNVKEAFEIPITMLRKSNSMNMVKSWLKDKESRRVLAEIYERFHHILNDFDTMNEYQIQYLKECLVRDENADKRKLRFFKEFYNSLEKSEDEHVDYYATYTALMDYQRLSDMVNKRGRIFPSYLKLIKGGVEKIWEMYDLLRFYVENAERVDKDMHEISKALEEKYAFEDDYYVIVVPKSIRDILEEAENQRNCLYTYVEDILEKNTAVLFMRTKESPKESFVTVEIRNHKIEQAKRRFNEDVTFAQSQFLKKFSLSKGMGRY